MHARKHQCIHQKGAQKRWASITGFSTIDRTCFERFYSGVCGLLLALACRPSAAFVVLWHYSLGYSLQFSVKMSSGRRFINIRNISFYLVFSTFIRVIRIFGQFICKRKQEQFIWWYLSCLDAWFNLHSSRLSLSLFRLFWTSFKLPCFSKTNKC